MRNDLIIFRVHAVERMLQRQVDEEDVRDSGNGGEDI